MVNFFRQMAARFFFQNSWYWKFRSKSVTRGYWKNRNHPSNEFLHHLVENIEFQTVLEIGSNCGNRLWGLGLKYPKAHFTGIDLNRYAVEFGNQQLRNAGVHNIRLIHGEAGQARAAMNGPVDIVFSWATLIYIGPRKIEPVLHDIFLSSHKTVILIEMHDDNLSSEKNIRGILVPPRNWKRNYVELVKQLGITERQIQIMDVPQNVWNPGGGHARAIIIDRSEKCVTS